MHALLTPVGPDWYAIGMPAVREVVAAPGLAAVPTAPAPVLGLFNLRGEIVPLFDTAALLGLGGGTTSEFAVVVFTAAGPAGLAATGAPEAVELGDPIGGAEIVGGLSSYAIDGRVATLVDVDVLLAPAHTGGLAQ
ncbi:MAG: chemotaxis protein CheW [Actinobacteria bacterium]|nr:chemotaxis protein CheW [Actinomycetota bacterium]